MAALDTPTSGSVFLGDTELAHLKDKALTELRRDQIGFVFQAYNLVPTLSAEENILLPLAIAGKKPDADWFTTVITAVGLYDRLHHRPSEMSGGQQQRVACARALMSRPTIIFADEPTGNLDSTASAEILTFLKRSVQEFGQTVVPCLFTNLSASGDIPQSGPEDASQSGHQVPSSRVLGLYRSRTSARILMGGSGQTSGP